MWQIKISIKYSTCKWHKHAHTIAEIKPIENAKDSMDCVVCTHNIGRMLFAFRFNANKIATAYYRCRCESDSAGTTNVLYVYIAMKSSTICFGMKMAKTKSKRVGNMKNHTHTHTNRDTGRVKTDDKAVEMCKDKFPSLSSRLAGRLVCVPLLLSFI